MRRDVLPSCVAVATSIAAVLVTAFGIQAPAVRVPVGVLAALVAPGFVLQQALFPGNRLDRVERCALTLGSSLILGVIGALLLNVTGIGLTPLAWALLLAGVTGIATGIVVVRAHRATPAPDTATPHNPQRARIRPAVMVLPVLTVLAAVTLTSASVVIARSGAERAAAASTFTQLWLMPRMGQPSRVDVGVVNHESATVGYRLNLVVGRRTVHRYKLTLRDGESWRQEINLTAFAGKQAKAVLFRTDQAARPYREVRLWQVRR